MFRASFLIAAALIFVVVILPTTVVAQPHYITYQGSLTKDGLPYNGTAEFKFVLFEEVGDVNKVETKIPAADVDNVLWSNDGSSTAGEEPSVSVGLNVTQGVFTVYLGKAPMVGMSTASLAASEAVWLRVWVDTGDGIEQLPDQLVASSAYSLLSESARSSLGPFDVGTELRVGTGIRFPDDSFLTTADVGAGGDTPWIVNGIHVYRPEGGVGIGIDVPLCPLDVRSTTGTNWGNKGIHYGRDGREGGAWISSYDDDQAIFAAGSYYHTHGEWTAKGPSSSGIMFRGGETYFYGNTNLTPDTDFLPTQRMRLDTAGNLSLSRDLDVTRETRLNTLNVSSSATFNNGMAVLSDGSTAYEGGILHTQGLNRKWQQSVAYTGSESTARMAFRLVNLFTPPSGPPIFMVEAPDVLVLAGTGNVGFGAADPQQKLHVADGSILVNGDEYGDGALARIHVDAGASWGQYLLRLENDRGVQMAVTGTGRVGIGTDTPSTALEVWGNVTLKNSSGDVIVELGEGLDYAEGFDVTESDNVSPGAVLVIDFANPGQLVKCSKAYDRRVAGIVAGGNGLGSAVKLGVGRFDHDVALAGRVYCNVTASNGAIVPGDLLTTSDTPGYAMKALDDSRTHGAILGKAMEGMAQGHTGQILVLVTLQ